MRTAAFRGRVAGIPSRFSSSASVFSASTPVFACVSVLSIARLVFLNQRQQAVAHLPGRGVLLGRIGVRILLPLPEILILLVFLLILLIFLSLVLLFFLLFLLSRSSVSAAGVDVGILHACQLFLIHGKCGGGQIHAGSIRLLRSHGIFRSRMSKPGCQKHKNSCQAY